MLLVLAEQVGCAGSLAGIPSRMACTFLFSSYTRGSIPPPHGPAGHKVFWSVAGVSERGVLADWPAPHRHGGLRNLKPEGAAQAALQKQMLHWVGRGLDPRSRPV